MKRQRFRNLNLNLPQTPVVDQRPWIVGGWLFLLLFLLMAAFAFLYKNEPAKGKQPTYEVADTAGR